MICPNRPHSSALPPLPWTVPRRVSAVAVAALLSVSLCGSSSAAPTTPPSKTPPASTPGTSAAQEDPSPVGEKLTGLAWEWSDNGITDKDGKPVVPTWTLTIRKTAAGATQDATETLEATECNAPPPEGALVPKGAQTYCAELTCPGQGVYAFSLTAMTNGQPAHPLTMGLDASCKVISYEEAVATHVPTDEGTSNTDTGTGTTDEGKDTTGSPETDTEDGEMAEVDETSLPPPPLRPADPFEEPEEPGEGDNPHAVKVREILTKWYALVQDYDEALTTIEETYATALEAYKTKKTQEGYTKVLAARDKAMADYDTLLEKTQTQYMAYNTDWQKEMVALVDDLTGEEEPTETAQADPATDTTETGTSGAGTTDTGTPGKEPTKTDPGKTDPGKTDTGKTDTAKTDTGKTDTGKTDTGKTDTGKTDTAKATSTTMKQTMTSTPTTTPDTRAAQTTPSN